MRFLSFIYLGMLLLSSCTQQKSAAPVGIGLFEVNTEYDLPLFKHAEDSLPHDIIIFKNRNSGVVNFKSRVRLQPYEWYKGDTKREAEERRGHGLVGIGPSLKFRVIDTTATTFTIVTDEDRDERFVVKKENKNRYFSDFWSLVGRGSESTLGKSAEDRWYLFETWERYLKRVQYIGINNPVFFDRPKGKPIKNFGGNEFFFGRVQQVEKDWIHVSLDNSETPATGWLRWRKGDSILISMTEFTYE